MSNMTFVLKAAEFAADKHRRQRRKGKKKRPYIGHCIEVARLLAEVAEVVDGNILTAAILHDTVEDTKTTPEEIGKEFGPIVEGLVMEVTDDKSLHKAERKELQVKHAPDLSPGAKLIKLADKISNVREIGTDPPKDWDRERRHKYFSWAKRVVNAMGSINPALEKVFVDVVDEAISLVDEAD